MALPGLGIVGRQLGRLGDRHIAGFVLAGAVDNHMAAVNFLRVEPQVVLFRRFQRQLVVLPVVAAHIDGVALVGLEHHGLGRLLLHLLFAAAALEVAAVGQFRPDIGNVLFPLGPAQGIEDAAKIGVLLLALFNEPRQHLFGVLGLGVVLVELGGVLLGRQGGRQWDVDFLHVRVVEIHRRQTGLATGDGVEVGRDDIAQLPQPFPVIGGGQLLPLDFQLPGRPVPKIGQRLVDGLALLAHLLAPLPAGVEPVQQGREGGERLILPQGPVLLQRAVGIVLGAALPQQQRGRIGAVEPRKLLGQIVGQRFILRFCGTTLRIAAVAAGQLPANHRRQRRKVGLEPFVQLNVPRFPAQQGQNGVPVRLCRVPLFLGGRVLIKQARQNLALFAHLKVHPAQTVDDSAVAAAENQIGIAAHDLNDQPLLHRLAHFIGAVQNEVQKPLHGRLANLRNTAAHQMLAQQHTEHGRLGGVFKGFLGELGPRGVGAGRQQQLPVGVPGP